MGTNFPVALDALTNPAPASSQLQLAHSKQHEDANDALEALQAKVGIDGSADEDSHDFKLAAIADSEDGKGAARVGFHDVAAPAILKVTSDLLNGIPVNILRNIAKSRWAGIQARSDTEDCAAAIMDLMDGAFNVGTKQIVLRVPLGTFTLHQPIQRLAGSVAFRLVGDDNRRSILTRGSDWAPGVGTGSLFNISEVDEHTIENLRLVGGAALYPTYANHAIACSNSNHVTYRGLYIEDWKNSGILVFHYPGSPTPASPQEQNNLIADCYLDGDGIANNGILFVDQFYSTIRNCVVRDLGKTGSPQYALQFKNRCWRSSIENCVAVNARAGVAFGQDGGVGADQCMVSDVMVRDCTWGIYMGGASNSSVNNVNIDMAGQGSHPIEMVDCTENSLTNIKVTGQVVGSGQYSAKLTDASCDNLIHFSTLNIQDTIPEIMSCDAAALNNVVIVDKLKNTAALSYTDQGLLDNAPTAGNALEIGGYDTTSAVVIASGAVTVKNPRARSVRVDTEGSAATDDLDTITGIGRSGQRIVLKSANSSRDVVVRHLGGGTGNIVTKSGANVTLGTIASRIELQYEAGLSQWVEV